jgi:TPR repeat protein
MDPSRAFCAVEYDVFGRPHEARHFSFLPPAHFFICDRCRNGAAKQSTETQSVQSAVSRYKEKHEGVQLLLAKAKQGDSGAQFWSGVAYEEGWCTKSDLKKALRFYSQAAEQGDPDVQNSLGQMYEEGRGVKQDYALAAKWYLKAAEHAPDLGGAGQGRDNLGMLYLQGLGVPKDYVSRLYVVSLGWNGKELIRGTSSDDSTSGT